MRWLLITCALTTFRKQAYGPSLLACFDESSSRYECNLNEEFGMWKKAAMLGAWTTPATLNLSFSVSFLIEKEECWPCHLNTSRKKTNEAVNDAGPLMGLNQTRLAFSVLFALLTFSPSCTRHQTTLASIAALSDHYHQRQ